MSKIINLFGGPSIGKSTQAAGLYYEMKKAGYNVEMPYEFPKLQAWERNVYAVKDQFYITANQHRNISRLYGQVDYIIVDSPILFGLIYKDRYNEELAEIYGLDLIKMGRKKKGLSLRLKYLFNKPSRYFIIILNYTNT